MGGAKSLSIAAFQGVCNKFRNNPLCTYADGLITVLAGETGRITEEALDRLVIALKYTRIPAKSLHGIRYPDRRHPETQSSLLPVPALPRLVEELAYKVGQKYRSLQVAFMRFDRDGDGVVNETDFIKSVTELGLSIPDSELHSLFSLLDTDHSSKLSFSQFTRLKGDPHFPVVERTPRPAKYVDREETQSMSPSQASGRRNTSSVTPSRLYFGARRTPRDILPSDRNPSHAYGSRTPYSDDVKDLISNTYEHQFLEKFHRHQLDLSLRKERRKGATLTHAVIVRNEAIRSRFEPKKPKKEWKLPKFALKPLQKAAKLLETT